MRFGLLLAPVLALAACGKPSQCCARSGHSAVEIGGEILVLGGRDELDPESTEERRALRFKSDGTCEVLGKNEIPYQIAHGAAAVLNGKAYMLGGSQWTSAMGSSGNDIWNVSSDGRWIKVEASTRWSPRWDHAAVTHNGAVYVMGGFGETHLNDVWVSSDLSEWKCILAAAPWGARAGHAVVSHDGKIFLFGGRPRGGGLANDVWSSADGVKWTLVQAQAPWSDRFAMAAVSFQGQIILLGGFASVETNDVWASPDGKRWTQLASNAPWAPRSGHAAVVHDNEIWVIGGSNTPDAWRSKDGKDWQRVRGR